MDLEQMRVVITASTQKLQKQLQDVNHKLGLVDKTTIDTEKGFKKVGSTGVEAFTKIRQSAEAYTKTLTSMAKVWADYRYLGMPDNGSEPWKMSLKDLRKQLKEFERLIPKLQADLFKTIEEGADPSATYAILKDFEAQAERIKAIFNEIEM